MKKTDKYVTDIASCAEPGWTIIVIAFEVGAKGWIPPSFNRCFKRLGFPSGRVRALANVCQHVALKCSYLIWINRFDKSFLPWRIGLSDHQDFSHRRSRSTNALSANCEPRCVISEEVAANISLKRRTAMERLQTSEKRATIPRESQKQRKIDAVKFNVSEEKKSAIPSDPGKKRVRWADKYNGSLNEIRTYTLS